MLRQDLRKFAEENGFSTNDNYAWGTYNGYNMYFDGGMREPGAIHEQIELVICYHVPSEQAAMKFQDKYVSERKYKIEFPIFDQEESIISFKKNPDDFQNMINYLNEILPLMKQNGFKGSEYCSHCGKMLSAEERQGRFDPEWDTPLFTHEACQKEIEAELDAYESESSLGNAIGAVKSVFGKKTGDALSEKPQDPFEEEDKKEKRKETVIKIVVALIVAGMALYYFLQR